MHDHPHDPASVHDPHAALHALGWDAALAADLPAGALPGRAVRVDRGQATVATASDTLRAETGRCVVVAGDWVTIERGDPLRVTAVLPRRTALVRHAAGEATTEQALAANVDVVFLAVPIDRGPNLRRLERGLALAWSSGATPVVVLTKADGAADAAAAVADVETVALGIDIVVTSGVTGAGVDGLRRWTSAGPTGRVPTVVLLGASGAGKSTLLNALAGAEVMATGAVRAQDARGRHTTTHRELVVLPDGGLIIDTPGTRTLGLFADGEGARRREAFANADGKTREARQRRPSGLEATFADIVALAAACRFSDCAHAGEPGCAVAAGVAPDRLASWHKLQRELAAVAARHDKRLAAQRRKQSMPFVRETRRRAKERDGR